MGTYETLLEIEKARKKRLLAGGRRDPNSPPFGTGGTFTPPMTRYQEPSESYGDYLVPETEPTIQQKILNRQQVTPPSKIPPTPANLPAPPPPPATDRSWLRRGATKVGKGIKAGLGELFQAVAMGPQNYQQMQQYKSMLPYQEAAEARKLAAQKELLAMRPTSAKEQFAQELKTKIENGTATDEEKQHYNIMMGATNKPKDLTPKELTPMETREKQLETIIMATGYYTDFDNFKSPEEALADIDSDDILKEALTPAQLTTLKTQVNNIWKKSEVVKTHWFSANEPTGQYKALEKK